MASDSQERITSITHSDVEDAYARWAPVYDFVFALVMKPGRKAAAARLMCPQPSLR